MGHKPTYYKLLPCHCWRRSGLIGYRICCLPPDSGICPYRGGKVANVITVGCALVAVIARCCPGEGDIITSLILNGKVRYRRWRDLIYRYYRTVDKIPRFPEVTVT